MPISLRELRESDRPAVEAVLVDTGAFTDEEVRAALEVVDEGLTGAEDYMFVVAEAAGQLVGYGCWGRAPFTEYTWEGYWLAVRRKWQGTRVADAVMRHGEECAREQGARILLIDTGSKPAHKRAVDFYLARGYREVARITDFYGPSDDRITYRKDLTCPQDGTDQPETSRSERSRRRVTKSAAGSTPPANDSANGWPTSPTDN
jgi:predicted N-acetyltransferase YhbS